MIVMACGTSECLSCLHIYFYAACFLAAVTGPLQSIGLLPLTPSTKQSSDTSNALISFHFWLVPLVHVRRPASADFALIAAHNGLDGTRYDERLVSDMETSAKA